MGGGSHGLAYPSGRLTNSPGVYAAVELFVQRAQQVQAGFSLAANTQAVIDICQRVGGMPLGLELAATWLRVMPCQEIAPQIERSLDFLTTAVRNVPERHRSLRAVLDHSWNLLSEAERQVLARLSIFRGGFDLEAATRSPAQRCHCWPAWPTSRSFASARRGATTCTNCCGSTWLNG